MYIVMGMSGAGKDTVGEWLLKEPRSKLVKFAAPGKRVLEFMMRIPEGSLDNRAFRMSIAPNCQGRTYLQVLIDFYIHKEKVIGKDLFTNQTMEVILEHVASFRDIIITDLRSWDECEAILSIAEDVELNVIWVYRKGGKMLESDKLQWTAFTELKKVALHSFTLSNDGTKQELYDMLGTLLYGN